MPPRSAEISKTQEQILTFRLPPWARKVPRDCAVSMLCTQALEPAHLGAAALSAWASLRHVTEAGSEVQAVPLLHWTAAFQTPLRRLSVRFLPRLRAPSPQQTPLPASHRPPQGGPTPLGLTGPLERAPARVRRREAALDPNTTGMRPRAPEDCASRLTPARARGPARPCTCRCRGRAGRGQRCCRTRRLRPRSLARYQALPLQGRHRTEA